MQFATSNPTSSLPTIRPTDVERAFRDANPGVGMTNFPRLVAVDKPTLCQTIPEYFNNYDAGMSRRNHETKGAIVDGASGFRFYLDVRRLISSVFIPQSSAHIGSAAPVSSGGSQKEVNGKWVPAEDQTEDSSWVKDLITTMQKKLPVLLIMGHDCDGCPIRFPPGIKYCVMGFAQIVRVWPKKYKDFRTFRIEYEFLSPPKLSCFVSPLAWTMFTPLSEKKKTADTSVCDSRQQITRVHLYVNFPIRINPHYQARGTNNGVARDNMEMTFDCRYIYETKIASGTLPLIFSTPEYCETILQMLDLPDDKKHELLLNGTISPNDLQMPLSKILGPLAVSDSRIWLPMCTCVLASSGVLA